jgi:hypothetical protein
MLVDINVPHAFNRDILAECVRPYEALGVTAVHVWCADAGAQKGLFLAAEVSVDGRGISLDTRDVARDGDLARQVGVLAARLQALWHQLTP